MDRSESEVVQKIGTLKEKTMHSVIKNYVEPDPHKQEIKIGRYYADVLNESGIFEVQTQNFNLLRKKLDVFLENNIVTIVHPLIATKWICWIDEETGEISKKRKSPVQGSYYRSFVELYKIKSYLLNKNIRIQLILVNAKEYRLLNGWSEDKKRGASRYDRIPTEIVEVKTIKSKEDYSDLVPAGLEETFTTKDFIKVAKVSPKMGQCAMNVLHYVGAVERIGKQGRAYVYRRTED